MLIRMYWVVRVTSFPVGFRIMGFIRVHGVNIHGLNRVTPFHVGVYYRFFLEEYGGKLGSNELIGLRHFLWGLKSCYIGYRGLIRIYGLTFGAN